MRYYHDVYLQMYQARPFLFLLAERSLFHPEQIADVIEIVRLAVFLSDLLLDELVPIIYRESLGRYHHFIPVRFNVVLFRRFGYVQSIEFYSSCNFLLPFKDGQWYLNKYKYSVIFLYHDSHISVEFVKTFH